MCSILCTTRTFQACQEIISLYMWFTVSTYHMKTSSNFENIHWQLMASLKLVTFLMTTYKLVFLDIIFLAVGLLQLSPFHDNESIVERRIQTSERTVDPNTMTKNKQRKTKQKQNLETTQTPTQIGSTRRRQEGKASYALNIILVAKA